MTPEEAEKALVKIEKDIPEKVFGIVQKYAGLTLVSDISNRVVMRQRNARGARFSRYSDKPILSSGTTERGTHVWRALASTKSKRRDLDWVTIKKGGRNIHLFVVPGGYAEIRRLSGFTNRRKSFEWTGEMWKKFGVRKSQRRPTGFTIRLAGLTPEAQRKLDANSEREGINIIDITPREERELAGYVDRWLQKEINKRL